MNENTHSKNNPIVDLTYKFALDVTVIASLLRRKKENDLASQLWRAGTSIGANVEEAQAAQSRADFRSKMSIAAKEARETNYWLRLARDTRLLDPAQAKDIIAQIQSIMKILTSIVKSSSNSSSKIHHSTSLPPPPPPPPTLIIQNSSFKIKHRALRALRVSPSPSSSIFPHPWPAFTRYQLIAEATYLP